MHPDDDPLEALVFDLLDSAPGTATAAELTRAAGPTWATDMPTVLAELTRRGDVILGWDNCFRLPGGPSRDARGIRRRVLPRPGTAARRALA